VTPGLRARRLTTVALLLGFGVSAACNSGPSQVVIPPVLALVASGDSQYGTTGQTLTTPLQVLVRGITTELPRSGVTILWTVEEGDATLVSASTAVTDSAGSAQATVRLGETTGSVVVRAAVQGQGAFADFLLFTVDRPTLAEIAPAGADPGSSIILSGQNFSPDPEQNVVLFSGVRGRVTEATSTSLTVIVPTCLPEREVVVTAQLGSVASQGRPFSVGPGGEVRAMNVGEVVDATDPDGFGCIMLPGAGGADYLVLIQSASRVGSATHPVRFRGLSATGSALQAASAGVQGPLFVPSASRDEADVSDPQARWDEYLRELEREATRGRAAAPGSTAPPPSGPRRADGPSAVPQVGEERTFQVFAGTGSFTEVTAVAEHVGERAAFFVDRDAPVGGLSQADLVELSARFDDFIHPTVTARFGGESDLDENDRVVILFSPAVNSLTARGSSGFIGGFFFGVDLLPERQGSNGAEIFYTLVPDPAGIFSDPRSLETILQTVPAILAHEFQHMVNFNQRVLILGAEANEAVWLSEGLAQFAEEVVARAYDDVVDALSAAMFRNGTRDRSRRYLVRPDTISLIVSSGNGTLAERGAGYLFVLYLASQYGEDIVTRLTQTTRTSVTNVEAETGTDWEPGVADWWSALYLDDSPIGTGRLAFPDVDVREFLGQPFPLDPSVMGEDDFERSGELPSGSAAYFIVSPAVGGTTTVRLGGEGGGPTAPQASLQMRVIRIR